eukprot:5560916-Lingulodinium_polyedra.AAC.1
MPCVCGWSASLREDVCVLADAERLERRERRGTGRWRAWGVLLEGMVKPWRAATSGASTCGRHCWQAAH